MSFGVPVVHVFVVSRAVSWVSLEVRLIGCASSFAIMVYLDELAIVSAVSVRIGDVRCAVRGLQNAILVVAQVLVILVLIGHDEKSSSRVVVFPESSRDHSAVRRYTSRSVASSPIELLGPCIRIS